LGGIPEKCKVFFGFFARRTLGRGQGGLRKGKKSHDFRIELHSASPDSGVHGGGNRPGIRNDVVNVGAAVTILETLAC